MNNFPTTPQESIQNKNEFDSIVNMFNSSAQQLEKPKIHSSNSAPSSLSNVSKNLKSRKFKITRKKMVYNGSGYGTASQPKRLDSIKRIKLDNDDKQELALPDKKISGTAQALLDVLSADYCTPSKVVVPKVQLNPYLPKPKEPESIIYSNDQDSVMSENGFVSLNLMKQNKRITKSDSVVVDPQEPKDVEMSAEPLKPPKVPSFTPFIPPITPSQSKPVETTKVEKKLEAIVPSLDVLESIKNMEENELKIFEFESSPSTSKWIHTNVGKQVAQLASTDLPLFDFILEKKDTIPSTFSATTTTTFSSNGFTMPISTGTGWTCNICLVPNKQDVKKCIACESDHIETPAPRTNTTVSNATGFSTEFTSEFTIPTSTGNGWTCDTCLVSNKQDAKKCIACESDKPGTKSQPSLFIPSMPVPPVSDFKWGSFK